jgi:hypothetical protein
MTMAGKYKQNGIAKYFNRETGKEQAAPRTPHATGASRDDGSQHHLQQKRLTGIKRSTSERDEV